MNDLSRDTLTPVPTPAIAPTRPAVAPVAPVATAGAPQTSLQEGTAAPETPSSDPLTRQTGLELADIWQSVAGEEPRKSAAKSVKRADDGARPVLRGEEEETPGTIHLGTGQTEKVGMSLPGGPVGNEDPLQGSNPTSGPANGGDTGQNPTSGPVGGPREEAAAAPPVQDAGKVAENPPADSGANQAARTETTAREAGTQQTTQAQQKAATEETKASNQHESERVERKETDLAHRERDLSSKESHLGALRTTIEAKSRQVAELRGRVQQKESQLGQIDSDINQISSAQDYLEHADEVERLHTMRYHVQIELYQEKTAAAQAESDLRETQRQAAELESSVDQGKREVSNQRYQLSVDKNSLSARQSGVEQQETSQRESRQSLAEVAELRPFWAALRDGDGFDAIAREAGANRLELEDRDQDARRRIGANLAALSDPHAAVDLVQDLDPTRATRAEQALLAMQMPLEKVRGA